MVCLTLLDIIQPLWYSVLLAHRNITLQKNQHVTWKRTVSKGKSSCNQHFSDILDFRGSRKLSCDNWEAKLLLQVITASKTSSKSITHPRGTSMEMQFQFWISTAHGGFSSQVFFFWFLTSWRLNQPMFNKYARQMDHLPRVGLKTKKNKTTTGHLKILFRFCQFLVESISTPPLTPSCQMNSSMQVLLHDHLQLSLRLMHRVASHGNRDAKQSDV